MKKSLVILFLLIISAGIGFASTTQDPYALQVKKLYAEPDEESTLIYNIPIEVRLLDVSGDGNWYKVKISYNIGPLSYTYVGWTRIPVGDILASRAEKVAKTPASELTE